MNRWRVAVAAISLEILASYVQKIRPWMLRWGATSEEGDRPLPGDELVSHPTHITTRAITIGAPPQNIWPWLVQMGQDRAGFYTHNWVERLLLSGIPDVQAIHPEWQDLKVGDVMRTNRDLRPGQPPLGWPVAQIAPPHSLVLRSRSMPVGTYAFVLDRLSAHETRLLVRDRALWPWWQWPFRVLIYEPLHAYMQMGQLRGIKQRAEHLEENSAINSGVRPAGLPSGLERVPAFAYGRHERNE